MDMELTGSANCLASGVQVGEYRLQGVVGEGGFGIVYRARDLSLDRIVAVKEYMPSTLAGRTSSNQIHVRAQHKGAFDAGLRSFINEARLLAKFSHPALVHVYRFFEENGTAYMVMRYYEGQTFRAFLAEQENAMSERWLSAMLSPILDVLEMLHAADCFHRDIAPDNVFLQASGMPVLLDFGAARRIIGDMTQALTMVLKPGFAPIEQYADDGGMPQGAWTDVYQLGAMLYLAITGKVPTTSVARMISDPIRMLTPSDYPGYSVQFLQGVHRALAVKPLDRPQSIAELKGLLGIRTFTAPAMSAWSASSTMPLDMFSVDTLPTSLQKQPEVRVPGRIAPTGEPQQPEAMPGPAAAAVNVQDEPTALLHPVQEAPGVLSADPPAHDERVVAEQFASSFKPNATIQGSADAWVAPPIVTMPLSAPVDLSRAHVGNVPVPDRRRPREVEVDGGAAANRRASGTARQNSWSWKTVVLIGAVVVSLVGGWLLTRGGGAIDEATVFSSDAASWETAKKEGTVQSLEAYLISFPAGDHALEARSMLTTLTQASAAAVRSSEVLAALTQERAAAELAAEVKAAAVTAAAAAKAQAVLSATVPAAASPAMPTKPVPVVPPAVAVTVNPSVNTGANAGRPAVEPPKIEAPPIVLADTKRATSIEKGTVTLRVTPWGNVRVNRSPVGTTPPLNQLDLPEGQHQIEISNPAGPSVTRTVQVKKGEPVVFSHKFE
jgi:serine/threonine protein kinase